MFLQVDKATSARDELLFLLIFLVSDNFDDNR